ncbi:MAG: HD domain-containing protein [Deltaproteobacteria bacterium]|nr:MAG: HD domain-containing protein [Deltaproteobacteria bacterium]
MNFNLESLKQGLDDREQGYLSSLSTMSKNGNRRNQEAHLDKGYRQAFSVDVDRILHSLAYTRYIDKTQVFYLVKNDHVTHRVLHVQIVSKVARTIGRFLRLNEDLIEAIALGHDIGHVPFGHEGETYLSGLCKNAGIGNFRHNVQSIRFLDQLEKKGRGWNLCLQTLDGILCHDGETHTRKLEPEKNRTFEILDQNIKELTTGSLHTVIPMTLEGCVVRMADTIAYIGRDIEDGIRLGLIARNDLPENAVSLLGETNGTIVYKLVTDLIATSYGNPYIAFSPEISNALKSLKAFNYKNIYLNQRIKKNSKTIEEMFQYLFETSLEDLSNKNRSSLIYSNFLEDMSESYLESNSHPEIVRDFIAGMTDRYFIELCPENMRSRLRYTF